MSSILSNNSEFSSDRQPKANLTLIILIAIFAVLTHWGVWQNGVYSMGWNTTVVWFAIGVMLFTKNDQIELKYDWYWLLPLALLALSFSLYQNPWLKAICFIVMPVAVGVFTSFGHYAAKRSQVWSMRFIARLSLNTFGVLPAIPSSLGLVKNGVFSKLEDSNLSVAKRVLNALLILLPLMFVILLLLSSADDNFDSMVGRWFTLLGEFFNWSIAAKAISIFILSGILIAVVTTLKQTSEWQSEFCSRAVDDLIASIVLTAILLVYIAFLNLQLDYLLVKQLPIEFADTERLVKSGFWQLFFLSMINVGLFYWVYKNTGPAVQWVLRLYLIASALILLSAGWRMGLYVFYYGLSYEKFFASYTTIYALILFVFLGWSVFGSKRKDIIKFLCVSSLWMFSIASIMPVERIIFTSNVRLAQNQESRINLFHLSDLSTDVLSLAMNEFNSGDFNNKRAWSSWLRSRVSLDCHRPWYETNLSLEYNCRAVSLDNLPDDNWKLY